MAEAPRSPREAPDSPSGSGEPALGGLSPEDMIISLRERESNNKVHRSFILVHPTYTPRIRAMLVNFFGDVCKELHMHRSIFHLAVHLLDVLMSTTCTYTVEETMTHAYICLLEAVKIEDRVRAYKVGEQIIGCFEGIKLGKIEAQILPKLFDATFDVTPETWLNTMFQILNNPAEPMPEQLEADHPKRAYVTAAALIDFFSADVESLRWSYMVITAAAISFVTEFEDITSLIPFTDEEIEQIFECREWMAPDANMVKEKIARVAEDPDLQWDEYDHKFFHADSYALIKFPRDEPLPIVQEMALLMVEMRKKFKIIRQRAAERAAAQAAAQAGGQTVTITRVRAQADAQAATPADAQADAQAAGQTVTITRVRAQADAQAATPAAAQAAAPAVGQTVTIRRVRSKIPLPLGGFTYRPKTPDMTG